MNHLQEPVDIEVFENNDAEVALSLLKEFTDGSGEAPMNLTGASFDFYVKRKPTDPNAEALLHYSEEVVVTDPVGGKLTVNFVGTDLTVPGWYHYNLDMTVSSKRRTVGYGRLVVRNI